MNEKDNRNFIVAIVVLSVICTISIGFNIRFGRSVADNQRIREQQQNLERTVEQLTVERDTANETIRELGRLKQEARRIIDGIIGTTETAGTSLATANKILRHVIVSLQSLELLYGGDRGSGNDGVDSLGGD